MNRSWHSQQWFLLQVPPTRFESTSQCSSLLFSQWYVLNVIAFSALKVPQKCACMCELANKWVCATDGKKERSSKHTLYEFPKRESFEKTCFVSPGKRTVSATMPYMGGKRYLQELQPMSLGKKKRVSETRPCVGRKTEEFQQVCHIWVGRKMFQQGWRGGKRNGVNKLAMWWRKCSFRLTHVPNNRSHDKDYNHVITWPYVASAKKCTQQMGRTNNRAIVVILVLRRSYLLNSDQSRRHAHINFSPYSILF